MNETIDDLTVQFEENGQVIVNELDKVVLSKGAWTTILFRYQQWQPEKDCFGPDMGTICSVMIAPSSVVSGSSRATVLYGEKFCGTPCQMSSRESTRESGTRIYRVARVASVQKLPRPETAGVAEASAPPDASGFRARSPRINANSTAMPTAAETKFCTVSPAIWAR